MYSIMSSMANLLEQSRKENTCSLVYLSSFIIFPLTERQGGQRNITLYPKNETTPKEINSMIVRKFCAWSRSANVNIIDIINMMYRTKRSKFDLLSLYNQRPNIIPSFFVMFRMTAITIWKLFTFPAATKYSLKLT